MTTLTLLTDNFDRENTFVVQIGSKPYPRKCSLHRDRKVKGDGILWIMQHGVMICAKYSDAEIAERERLNASTPLKDGDEVTVDGEQYRVRIIGDYSTCAELDKI